MKKLIENSIKIKGIGHPDTKTVFDNVDPENHEFMPLTEIFNRSLSILYKYEEDGEEKLDKIFLKIINSQNEEEIKSFILENINKQLAK